jgi:P pilus assembly chaperone PapD
MSTPKHFLNSVSLRGSSLFILLAAGLILVTLFSSLTIKAQGDLMIMPRRIVFEGNKKSQELTLANTGKDTAKYTVSIVQFRMKEDGAFESITEPDPGQNFADKYLRFFPRTVTLAPNESQIVKVQLTKADKLAPGEYRSHIYFRAVPKQKPLGEEDAPADTTSISVKLVAVFGITIPAIIQVGESDMKVSISDISLQMTSDNIPRLNMTFNRTGNMSAYGDVSIDYIAPDGKSTQVGIVKGMAVYTPNKLRRLWIDLNKVAGVDYKTGKLHVVFSTPTDLKSSKIAEADFVLN